MVDFWVKSFDRSHHGNDDFNWCDLFRNFFPEVLFVFSILEDKLKVIMFYIAPSGQKIQKLEFSSRKSGHYKNWCPLGLELLGSLENTDMI